MKREWTTVIRDTIQPEIVYQVNRYYGKKIFKNIEKPLFNRYDGESYTIEDFLKWFDTSKDSYKVMIDKINEVFKE